MNNPLISICIPTYNGEKYLHECIDSCINQSFKNYEIIICDDCSTDNTVKIIEEYVSKSPNIKFKKNEKNLGLVGNWNKCIEYSTGEWIKFLFQDDYLLPESLITFNQYIDDKIDLLVCKRNFILDKIPTDDEKDYYQNRIKTLENTGFYFDGKFYFNSSEINAITIKNIYLNFIAEPSLTLIRKTTFITYGLFDADLKQICDFEFLCRLASNSGLGYINKKLCGFRIHNNSTTEKNVNKNINYKQHYLELLTLIEKLINKTDFQKLRSSMRFYDKIRWLIFIKYKSHIAFKAIKNENDKNDFIELKNKLKHYFYQPLDGIWIWALKIMKRY